MQDHSAWLMWHCSGTTLNQAQFANKTGVGFPVIISEMSDLAKENGFEITLIISLVLPLSYGTPGNSEQSMI